jgi:hypothetical protein
MTPGGSERPLRKEVRLSIYWLVVGMFVMLVSPGLSIYASVLINQHTITRTQEAQAQAEAAARVEGLRVYCRLIGTQVDVYSEAVTDVGRKAHDTWLEEYRRSGCLPRK